MSAAVVARGAGDPLLRVCSIIMPPPGLIKRFRTPLVRSWAEASSTAIWSCHTLSVSGN